MGIVSAKKIGEISRALDPKQALIAAVGDLSPYEVMFNKILVATYISPEKTSGGIIRPVDNVREDQFQSKVGLVLKKGPMAFVDDDANQFYGQNIEIGDWIVYRVGDGFQMIINGTHCRLLQDANIAMKVSSPELVY